ncbi:COG1765 Predicted redox protein, regulator of disulfide bond formation [Flavobacteriaceae bacterium]
MESKKVISSVSGEINNTNFQSKIIWRNGEFLMDEPINIGGNDSAPDPYSTLLAALAGCTLATIKLYSKRKNWTFKEIRINIDLCTGENNETLIEREIYFSDDISDFQRERLLFIAKKCPVSKILENNIIINTTI